MPAQQNPQMMAMLRMLMGQGNQPAVGNERTRKRRDDRRQLASMMHDQYDAAGMKGMPFTGAAVLPRRGQFDQSDYADIREGDIWRAPSPGAKSNLVQRSGYMIPYWTGPA